MGFFNLGERPGIKRANTIERIEELGKDVPFEVTIKRVLVLAQRGDWNGCEQALRYDSYVLTSSTEFSIRMPSLHGLESFTPIKPIQNNMYRISLIIILP